MVALDAVRERLHDLDEELVALAAERVRLARDVARTKAEQGLPTVDYAQERRVLERATAAAKGAGLDPAVAEEVMLRLIEASVTVQEDERLRIHGGGAGRTAVVIGGAGRMGGWLTRFLATQGHTVHVLDPAQPEDLDAAKAHVATADLVFLATPPSHIRDTYREWRAAPPGGIICDVASIKAPFMDAMQDLRAAGARIASIHPLFGPSVRVLRGVDLVVCDTGDDEAAATVERLFQPTTARMVHVPLERHDAWMADVLALAHATALAFVGALPDEPIPVRSSTLGALSDLAWGVTNESPQVYYEIQAGNPRAVEALDRLAAAVGDVRRLVDARDPAGFEAYMAAGKRRLQSHREAAP